MVYNGTVWYGIVGFNVPLDTVLVISETGNGVHMSYNMVQSGQAIKLLQITPYVNDFQTLNNPGS